jgi:hypothetical protein
MAKQTSKTKRARNNKITRVILPALYDTPGLSIPEVIDPATGKSVEALYFYAAQAGGVEVKNKKTGEVKFHAFPEGKLIEQYDEPVRTGKPGRPARRWKLTKNTRDRIRRQRAREAKANELVATPEPALV